MSSPFFTAKGELIVATGAGAIAPKSVGSNGQVLTADSGETGGIKWATPATPGGAELAYVEKTTDVSVTSTDAASPNAVVSAGAVTFDGSTRVCIEFFCPEVQGGTTAGSYVIVALWEGSNALGYFGAIGAAVATSVIAPMLSRRFITPASGSKTYEAKAHRIASNGTLNFGNASGNVDMPGYIRITVA